MHTMTSEKKDKSTDEPNFLFFTFHTVSFYLCAVLLWLFCFAMQS